MTYPRGSWKNLSLQRLDRVKAHRAEFNSSLRDAVDAVDQHAANPAPPSGAEAARLAVEKLREARDLLIAAGASRAVDRVRLALTSAGGAVRAAEGREVRERFPAPPVSPDIGAPGC